MKFFVYDESYLIFLSLLIVKRVVFLFLFFHIYGDHGDCIIRLFVILYISFLKNGELFQCHNFQYGIWELTLIFCKIIISIKTEQFVNIEQPAGENKGNIPVLNCANTPATLATCACI
jgi:hypothetical protein